MPQQDWNERSTDRSSHGSLTPTRSAARGEPTPGKQTLAAQLAPSPAASTSASERSAATVQRKASAAPASEPEVPPASGGGAAMPGDVQAKMENAFGTDFSAVRIHSGQRAESLGAMAYTQGTDIHFAPGHYDPHSQQGQELLGHELTHVVQQSQGMVRPTLQTKGVAINDDTALERHADEMGARAARAQPAQPAVSGSLGTTAERSSGSSPAAGDIHQRKAKAPGDAPVTHSLLVDDMATEITDGQVKKTVALELLRQAIHKVGVEVYSGTELTVDGCPYLAYWFARYAAKTSKDLERALQVYASAPATVGTVSDLITLVCARARRGFHSQVRTGNITELPDDVPKQIGDGVVPERPQPAQRKPLAGVSDSSPVVQRGCLGRGGGGGVVGPPAPVRQHVAMTSFTTINDGHTTLETSGFAGCIGIIVIAPGNTRTLAHIYSGHIQSANQWNQLAAFRAAAGAAITTHIYHAPSYWHQHDGDSGDQFIADFGLVGAIVFHGAPAVVSVDPALTVTP